jgi:hypothetical protein
VRWLLAVDAAAQDLDLGAVEFDGDRAPARHLAGAFVAERQHVDLLLVRQRLAPRLRRVDALRRADVDAVRLRKDRVFA